MDVANENFPIMTASAQIKHRYLILITIETKIQNFELFVPIFMPKEKINEHFEKIFEAMKGKGNFKFLSLSNIWEKIVSLVEEKVENICSFNKSQDDKNY